MSTPDAFNSCSTIPMYLAPYNSQGFQIPHWGNGYAGGVIYGNSRDYIQVELDSTLVSQEYYCVNFYVSRAGKLCQVAQNNIGMYFSNTSIYVPTYGVLNFIPQVNDTNLIVDSINWTEISGVFRALGGERYIIIGNFYPDSLTDTLQTAGTTSVTQGYYFIDDVSVMRCSDSGVGAEDEGKGVSIYPNPSVGLFELKSEKYKIKNVEVFNLLGEKITNCKFNSNTIDMRDAAKGIYFLQIQTEKGVVRKKVVIQ